MTPRKESAPAERRGVSGSAAPERLARLYFDYALSGILVTDLAGRVLQANPAAASIAGREVRQLEGKPFADLFVAASQERFLRHWNLLAEQGIAQAELHMATRDGELIVELASVQADESAFMHILDDVTAQRNAQAATERARVAAEEASRAKSEFLANVSHEIRTPLNGILGLGRLALDEELPDRAREYVEGMLRSGRSLLALVNDLLDAAKAEAGKFSVDPQPFLLAELFADLAGPRTAAGGDSPVEVSFVISPELPPGAVGDRQRIGQCLRNLLGNAIKFTPAGKVSLEADRSVQNGAQWMRFRVTDTGIGIPPEVMQRLFAPFSQADASTARRYGGSGLGLYLSRQLARSMGGDLSAESTPGRGSCFTLVLPLITAAARPTDAADGPAEIPAEFRGRRILLAEDDPTNRLVATRWLAKAGIEVSVARDGNEAVAMARQPPLPALILMDVQMPQLDGLAATRALRATGCTLPIIGLSAGVGRGEQDRCLAAGMSDFLPKPIDLDELWGCLTRWLPPAAATSAGPVPTSGIDDTILAAVTRSFRDHHGDDGSRLDELIRAGRRHDARLLAHSLRGAAAALDLGEISRLAAEMEALLEGTGTVSAGMCAALQRRLDAILEAAG